ncbi:MAG: class I SAM-dependent methyltransferase, partial [Bacteroidales bacterium]|nr:class I SAM-dependent methyltransferase [Bacteroidales bacterium]
GCGLDNRFERVDNGQIDFFDLDLPDIIEIKKQLFNETTRYQFIPQSVFDFSWMKRITGKDILFLAEGVFMYCKEKDVKSLFLKLQNSFPGSEIVCEVFNSLWLKGWLKKMMNFKMQKELNLGKDATFLFGIRHSHEMESWSNGISLLGDWSYFDSDEKKLGWIKIFRHIDLFRKTQWTVHYKLNVNPGS